MINTLFSSFITDLNERNYKLFSATFDEKKLIDDIYTLDSQSNILLIYGDNAAGKSLFTYILEATAKEENIPVRSASMSNRTKSGVEKAMLFGNESEESTGETSLRVALLSLDNTLQDDAKTTCLSILDEPDIGLSFRYTTALGQLIVQKANQMNQSGIVIVSHNKDLVHSIMTHYQKPISMIGINTNLNYNDWIKSLTPASVDELLELSSISSKKWRAITNLSK